MKPVTNERITMISRDISYRRNTSTFYRY